MIDNYSRKVLHASHKTSEGGRFTLDMTNSCTMHIPHHLAPANLSANSLCKFVLFYWRLMMGETPIRCTATAVALRVAA
eukprot:2630133-Pleurochrysis_carterae.AAC.1